MTPKTTQNAIGNKGDSINYSYLSFSAFPENKNNIGTFEQETR